MANDNHPKLELSEVDPADIRARIAEYLGEPCDSEPMGRITEAVRSFFALKNSTEREMALNSLGAFFCRHCGSGFLPCYCTRDD